MSDNKPTSKNLDKINTPVRQAARLEPHPGMVAAINAAHLKKSMISDALRSVLETQKRFAHLPAAVKNLPDFKHLNAINTALNSMPQETAQKVMRQTTSALPTIDPLSLSTQKPAASQSSKPYIHTVKDLGQAVRAERKNKGLTQQKFADLAGVVRRFVSELEQGKQTLEIGKVLKVAAAAGIHLLINSNAQNHE
jgi:y4mF family transcriptional regulator